MKKLISLFLAVLLLLLPACSKKNDTLLPTPGISDPADASTTALESQPSAETTVEPDSTTGTVAQTEAPTQATEETELTEPDATEATAPEELEWGGDGSLESFRKWALQTKPEAIVGIAKIGVLSDYTGGAPMWESLTSDGYPPFISRLGFENWVDFGAGFYNPTELWCVLPLSEEGVVTLSPASGESVRSDSPMLFYWIFDERLSVHVMDKGRETSFALEPGLLDGLRGKNTVLDFTVTPDTPLSRWRFHGWWEAQEGNKTHQLYLGEDGNLAHFVLENHKVLNCKEGKWNFDGTVISCGFAPGERFLLSYFSADTGYLHFSSVDDPMLFAQEDGLPLEFHGHFYPGPYDLTRGTREEQAMTLALDAYAAENGYRPDKAEVVRTGQVQLLVRIAGKDGAYGAAGWYLVDPEGKICNNYLTGTVVDLNP